MSLWKSRRLFILPTIVLLLLATYVGSYLVLSRRGYAQADEYGMKGFYYFFPENTDAWRYKNYGCVFLFWPLNTIDCAIGCGRHPAAEPMWGIAEIISD